MSDVVIESQLALSNEIELTQCLGVTQLSILCVCVCVCARHRKGVCVRHRKGVCVCASQKG